jgi:two-component system, sensor histidine kinase and response regulator
MGGDVGIESTPGQGSTFWFTVRVQVATDGVAKKRDTQKPPATSKAHHDILRGTRVLLAEDDTTNQLVAVGLLEAAGMQVDVAADGALALEMVPNKDYEIILMDMQMPNMDGLTATRLIRQDERFSELPIVAMTANAMQSHEAECLAAGMNDFIVKPFDPGQLYSVIQKWVTGAGDSELFAAPGSEAMQDFDISLLSQIKGLDVRAGLRRMAGMKGLYVSTLRSFVEKQADVVDRIRGSINSGDIDKAIRGAHTLKGLSGQIEAQAVTGLAAGIEATLTAGTPDRALPLLDRLAPILLLLHGSISVALQACDRAEN